MANTLIYLPQITQNFMYKSPGGFHPGFLALDTLGNFVVLIAAWGLRFPAVSYFVAGVPMCEDIIMDIQYLMYQGNTNDPEDETGAEAGGSRTTAEGEAITGAESADNKRPMLDEASDEPSGERAN